MLYVVIFSVSSSNFFPDIFETFSPHHYFDEMCMWTGVWWVGKFLTGSCCSSWLSSSQGGRRTTSHGWEQLWTPSGARGTSLTETLPARRYYRLETHTSQVLAVWLVPRRIEDISMVVGWMTRDQANFRPHLLLQLTLLKWAAGTYKPLSWDWSDSIRTGSQA